MSTGTSVDVSLSYNSQSFQVLGQFSLGRTKKFEDTTYFGATDQVQASAALRSIKDTPIEILYDDASTADGVFQAAYLADVAYPLVATWRSGKTSTVSAFVSDYERIGKVGGITREKVTLKFTGATVEA